MIGYINIDTGNIAGHHSSPNTLGLKWGENVRVTNKSSGSFLMTRFLHSFPHPRKNTTCSSLWFSHSFFFSSEDQYPMSIFCFILLVNSEGKQVANSHLALRGGSERGTNFLDGWFVPEVQQEKSEACQQTPRRIYHSAVTLDPMNTIPCIIHITERFDPSIDMLITIQWAQPLKEIFWFRVIW